MSAQFQIDYSGLLDLSDFFSWKFDGRYVLALAATVVLTLFVSALS